MHRTEVKKEKWKCTEHKNLTGKISKNIIARHIKCLKQLNHTIIVPTVRKLISQVYSLWLLKWRESAGGELPLSVPSLPSRIFANPDGLATLSFNYRTILNVDWSVLQTELSLNIIKMKKETWRELLVWAGEGRTKTTKPAFFSTLISYGWKTTNEVAHRCYWHL